jgi:hypothetical protein
MFFQLSLFSVHLFHASFGSLNSTKEKSFAILNLHYDFLSFTAEGRGFKFRLLSYRMKFISLFLLCRVLIDITTNVELSSPLPLPSISTQKKKAFKRFSIQQQQLILQYAFMFRSTPFLRHKIPMYISFTSCRLIFFFYTGTTFFSPSF